MATRVTRRRLLGGAVPGGSFLAARWTSPAHACQRTTIARLPLRLVDGYPLVEATLLGRRISLLLDTGAQAMLITPETAAALSLPLAGMTRIYGTGGSQEVPLVRLPGLRLGGAPMPDQTAPVATLPVALPSDPPLAGLLGASLLARFDLDLDVPGGTVSLAIPSDCPPPVTGTRLAMEVSRAGEPFVVVTINGQRLLALLDTGSRATLIRTETARRLGLDAPISANTARGVDGARHPLAHLRVRLALGDEPPVDTPVSVTPLQLEHGDMLLGLDQMLRRRLWIGYARGEAIVTPRVP